MSGRSSPRQAQPDPLAVYSDVEFAQWLADSHAKGDYPPAPQVNPFACGCAGCTAFLQEYGDLSDLYWRQQVWMTAGLLGVRGWSGGFTDGERAFMRTHGAPGFQQRRQRALALRRSTPQTKSDATVDAEGAAATAA